MSTGRSRGRARVRTEPQPVPVGGLLEQAGAAQPPPPLPTPTPTPATLNVATALAVERVSIAGLPPVPPVITTPSRTAYPDTSGRGRGISKTETAVTTLTTLSSTTLTTDGQGSGSGNGSPNGSPSSEESPPQQHSPPELAPPAQSVGRATLRGVIHQPIATARSEIVAGMERLGLTAGEAPQEIRPREYEAVLRTKPESCTVKVGTVGTPKKILCNYFEVLSAPNWELHQYHVDFNPPVDSKKLRIGLFNSVSEALFPNNKAFDGGTIYSLTRLEDVTERTVQSRHDQAMYQMKIKHVGSFVPTSPQFIHLFNLVFRRCLKLYGMQQLDRNYFDMTNRIDIPNYGVQLINGFATSIASYDEKLLLCVEITNKLLHKQTVFDLMKNIYQNTRDDESFREECQKRLIGRVIMTTYNHKTYKIDDINWQENPTTLFPIRGTPTPLHEYYKKQYNLAIQDLGQPLIINLLSSRDKRRGLTVDHRFVPELCILTGMDDKMREDFRFKKAVEEFSKVGSAERCRRVENFVNKFGKHKDCEAELGKWKILFAQNAASINSRVLQPETLQFGKGVVKQLNEKADWGNDMKGLALLAAVNLKKWIVIYPSSKKVSGSLFVKTYEEVMNGMNIDATKPSEIVIRTDDPSLITQTLKDNITESTQMVVVIVSSKRKDRYDAIKRICCLELPVPSQVITSQIIDDERKRRSVVTKVVIQMNCKLGGEVWMINIPIKNLMICGIDTYHDSQKKKSSVCAFVATSNHTKTKFFSRATIQETHQELSSNLLLTFKSACEHYRKVNGGLLPEKIIIYRDGISDGQLNMVKEAEIPQIEKAFALIEPNYRPTLAVIIVKKRGNARFFTDKPALGNPPCGTIVDTVVTRKEWFDFYLISQHVTQGTVNPTHYNVIHDTMGLKPEHYQRLSFKLCHLYYNWPGTIRVPSTCQYAHKLAFLVGQSLHKEHHLSLSDKLFYL